MSILSQWKCVSTLYMASWVTPWHEDREPQTISLCGLSLLMKEADSNAWVKLTYHWWPHYESIVRSCSLLSIVPSSTISMSSPDLYSNLLFSDLWKAPNDFLALYLYNCCFFFPGSTELLPVLQAKLLRVAAFGWQIL